MPAGSFFAGHKRVFPQEEFNVETPKFDVQTDPVDFQGAVSNAADVSGGTLLEK